MKHKDTRQVDSLEGARQAAKQQADAARQDEGAARQVAVLEDAQQATTRQIDVLEDAQQASTRQRDAAQQVEADHLIDPPATVSIDSDGAGPAVQLNGVDSQNVPPLFTPDEAEQLAEDLLLGADAARQAAQDGYNGPARVVPLANAESAARRAHQLRDWNSWGAAFEGFLSSTPWSGEQHASAHGTPQAEALIELYVAVGRRLSARCQTQSMRTYDHTQLEYNECTGGTHCSMCPITRAQAAVIRAFERIEALR